jgi:transposase
VLAERRQVVELQIRRKTTEYRIVGGTRTCGRVHHNAFPEDIKAPIQYGPGILTLAVYMTQYQLLPYQRTAGVLNELAGIAISPGTIHRAVTVAAARLEEPVAAIRGALIEAPVAHADETGMRVAGGLYWLHVLGTAWLTAYFPHPKRGAEALEACGLLAHSACSCTTTGRPTSVTNACMPSAIPIIYAS